MRLSEQIYRFLLKAYPRHYRRNYAEPMAQLFADQLQREIGAGALLRHWVRTLADLSHTVPARHIEYFLPGRDRCDRYGEAFRRSLFFARCEATGLSHDSITSEDLLAGLLREDHEIRGWLNPEALEDIGQTIGIAAGPPGGKVSEHMPLSDTVKKILSLAVVEAERTGTKGVTTRHIAVAILSQGQTLAADLLCRHGIDLDRLRTRPEPGA